VTDDNLAAQEATVYGQPLVYPNQWPPGRSLHHRPTGTCQFCGTVRKGARCKACGHDPAIDCRGVRTSISPYDRRVRCEHDGCGNRREPGVDAHETWDGWSMSFWCDFHCPECNIPTLFPESETTP
jgi:hypothetical protein